MSVVQNVIHISVLRFNFVVETAVYFVVLLTTVMLCDDAGVNGGFRHGQDRFRLWHAKILLLLLFYHRTNVSYLQYTYVCTMVCKSLVSVAVL